MQNIGEGETTPEVPLGFQCLDFGVTRTKFGVPPGFEPIVPSRGDSVAPHKEIPLGFNPIPLNFAPLDFPLLTNS